MANRGVDGDIRRAKELRNQAKSLTDSGAKADILEAAARYEKKAGAKARKLGRRRRRRSSNTQTVF